MRWANFKYPIQASGFRVYDLGEDARLLTKGIDNTFHENAHRCEFMNVLNGKLVIYHMWEQDDLRYTIIQISRKLRTTVKATLLITNLRSP